LNLTLINMRLYVSWRGELPGARPFIALAIQRAVSHGRFILQRFGYSSTIRKSFIDKCTGRPMSFWQTILLFLVGSWALGMVLIAAGAFVWVYRQKRINLPPASGPTRLSSSGSEPTLDKVNDPPRSFSGRTRELLRLVEHFEGVVMIRDSGGVPGVGKTSLARALAKQLARRFPDGSLEIDLRGHYKPLALSPAEAMRRLLWSLDLALELPDVEKRSRRSLPPDPAGELPDAGAG
jgi:hypothetical protein